MHLGRAENQSCAEQSADPGDIMPKKMGLNSKAVDAKAKKEETQKGKAAAAEKAQEDRAWKEAGDGAKSKAQAKKDEQVSGSL